MSRPLSLSPTVRPSERELRYRDFQRVLGLVSRLGSDNENEIFETVKALTRALQAAGLSWSDIGESIRERGIGDVKPAKRPKNWAEMSLAERLNFLEAAKKAPWAEEYHSWLIEKLDRYYVMPDPLFLAGLDVDELLAQSRRQHS